MAGDQAESCRAEGCDKKGNYAGRLCHVHSGTQAEIVQKAVRPCSVEGCPNRGCSGVRERPRCTKHFYRPDACTWRQCGEAREANGRCGKHQGPIEGTCSVRRCPSPRHKGGLCYRHYRLANAEQCGYPTCTFVTPDIYCKVHDIGVDFVAGDWFDWVAAERLYRGRTDGRKPTVPELRWVFQKASLAGVGVEELARRTGLDRLVLRQWHSAAARLSAVAA